MKSMNENDGQHIFTQSKSQKSNKRMMAGTITEETKREGQRKAKKCTPTFTPVLKATPPVHLQ